MLKLKFVLAASVVLASMPATTANAAISTFAQFSASSNARNVRWLRNGATSGSIYSTSTGTSASPGAALVRFEFLQPELASIGVVSSRFNLFGSSVNAPATFSSPNYTQVVQSGTFSFTNTTGFSFRNVFFAAGSNLLSGTFTDADIFGGGTSGSITDDSNTGTVVFTSDFLDFSETDERGFAFSLTSIAPMLAATPNRSLRSFRALAVGSFASEPAPTVSVVPEPEVWGLLVVGFGLVGLQVRRRARQSTVTA